MKRLVLSLLAACTLPAIAETNVGVSIGIHQPGVYGRIDIGNMPPPAIIYPQPVVIAPTPVAVYQRPIYLYVPPGHERDWARHCHRYNACGQPVYFVQERWVHEHARRDDHRRRYDDRRYRRDDDRRGRYDDDRRGRSDDRGRGRGRGRDDR